jgi:DNA-directed RNA polymerase specialized sigma subunit
MKYWKAEHDYNRQIKRTTRLTFHSINSSEDKVKFEAELQKFDKTYKNLKKQLKGNPNEDNIAEMLRFYQEKLITLQENIQNYTNTTIQSD